MLAHLDAEFSALMENAYASETSADYSYGWGLLAEFSRQSGFNIFRDGADQRAWIAYLLFLRLEKRIAYSTARKTFSAIRAKARTLGLDILFSDMPVLVLARKAWARETLPVRLKAIVTPENLSSLLAILGDDTFVALSVFLFYTLGRQKEAFNLLWSHMLRPVPGQAVSFFLPSSKTDAFRRGATLSLPWDIWCVIAKRLGVSPTNPPSSPSRMFPATSRRTFSAWLKKHLHLTGHSFRRGGAQFYWDLGVAPDVIKRKGRWRSEAWRLYIVTDQRDISEISKLLPPISDPQSIR
jgi:hypothetical protein